MKIAMFVLGVIGFLFFFPLFVAYWIVRLVIWIIQACFEKIGKDDVKIEVEGP